MILLKPTLPSVNPYHSPHMTLIKCCVLSTWQKPSDLHHRSAEGLWPWTRHKSSWNTQFYLIKWKIAQCGLSIKARWIQCGQLSSCQTKHHSAEINHHRFLHMTFVTIHLVLSHYSLFPSSQKIWLLETGWECLSLTWMRREKLNL